MCTSLSLPLSLSLSQLCVYVQKCRENKKVSRPPCQASRSLCSGEEEEARAKVGVLAHLQAQVRLHARDQEWSVRQGVRETMPHGCLLLNQLVGCGISCLTARHPPTPTHRHRHRHTHTHTDTHTHTQTQTHTDTHFFVWQFE